MTPDNPLLRTWATPCAVPPFSEIRAEHFLPAFEEAVARRRRAVEAIAGDAALPTFANTVEALEDSGELLERIAPVFHNLVSAETSESLQAANRLVTPMLTALQDDVNMNARLFDRVRAVWERRHDLAPTLEARRLVEETYKAFVRGGAALDDEGKVRLRALNAEIAVLGVKFGENLLHDTNAFRLVIDRRADLAGLPPSLIASAEASAERAGLPGKWLFTLHAPSIWPFLEYSARRDLREAILRAYVARGSHADEYDNRSVAATLASLRAERARLLGYESHAAYVLDESMAKVPDRVYTLLRQLWMPAVARARTDAGMLQDAVDAEGAGFALQAWDWRYYASKLKRERFAIDEQELRPYFPLDRVRDGAFDVARRLYGISVAPRADIPVYHPDVQAFEVKDADGAHLGVFYTDFHPRTGKRVGAWSSRYRIARTRGGRAVRPIVVNVCNFSRPIGADPALLSIGEVETLFHEFGHALHALLARVSYASLERVPRDFVELPSQIMENWALEPEVLQTYAKHYRTGEVIPTSLIDRIQQAKRFDQGLETVEYLAAAFLDMAWHVLPPGPAQNPDSFEQRALEAIQVPAEIGTRYRTPYFLHVFGPGGGYAAGYYSYIWSEVLDADAFSAFKARGLFDAATARSFRTNILEPGGIEDPAELYRRFRGRDAVVEPLLARRGLTGYPTGTR